jgi:hypothetical protein
VTLDLRIPSFEDHPPEPNLPAERKAGAFADFLISGV